MPFRCTFYYVIAWLVGACKFQRHNQPSSRVTIFRLHKGAGFAGREISLDVGIADMYYRQGRGVGMCRFVAEIAPVGTVKFNPVLILFDKRRDYIKFLVGKLQLRRFSYRAVSSVGCLLCRGSADCRDTKYGCYYIFNFQSHLQMILQILRQAVRRLRVRDARNLCWQAEAVPMPTLLWHPRHP